VDGGGGRGVAVGSPTLAAAGGGQARGGFEFPSLLSLPLGGQTARGRTKTAARRARGRPRGAC